MRADPDGRLRKTLSATASPSGRNTAARLVASNPFIVVVVATIAVNAVVLGLQTYDGVEERWGRTLDAVNAACVGVFMVELAIRIASYWPRPWEFFRNGWNIFDFVVIGATFVPGVAQNSTLLRIVRLLRVIRIVRVLPDLRVLLLGVWRSVPPLASIGAVTAMILFVYGMVGWVLFADELPEQWGNIGRAMLTLFVMLTLEDFPVYMAEAMEFEPWAWIYFVSFILVRLHRPERLDRGGPELDGGGTGARAPPRAPRAPRRRSSVADRPPSARTGRGADLDPEERPRRARAGARSRLRPACEQP